MLPEEIHNKKVFVSALDWGLGHCGRMIPIIELLIAQGNEIFFGGTQIQQQFFTKENLPITLLDFPGYNFDIPEKNWEWNFLKQLPRLNKVLKAEHKALDKIIAHHNIEVIISDHRYGAYSKQIQSIFVTHQMTLPASTGKQMINKIHTKKMSEFDQIWTIDDKENSNAGVLSQSINGLDNHYIGPLSRCKHLEVSTRFKALCIISGPEPHRTQLFDILKKISTNLNCSITIIAAQPEEQYEIQLGQVTILSHVNSEELNKLINESEWVISRSGYTTIMDILKLNKKTILIPTPGQGEQEYLGKFHSESNENIYCIEQSDLKTETIRSILFQE